MSVSQEIQSYLKNLDQLQLDEADKASDLSVTIQLKLLGDQGGNYGVRIHNNQINTGAGYAKEPDLIFTLTAEDYLAVAKGDVNPLSIAMSGRMKMEGDRVLAMRAAAILQSK